ncbi:zinc finger, CCHC-type containing protein [Tanacetum coccineum]
MFRLNIVSDNIGSAFMSTSKLNDSILWHARLGYVHFKRMQDMSKDGLIPAFDMDIEKCKTCMLTKITKKPFQIIKHKTEVLELIHSDLCDMHATPSLGNKKYFVTFIDDASRFCYVYLLHSKDEALDKFKVFKTKVELQQGSLIKRFRTDRGGEYMDTLYFQFVGIIHETTAPYTPKQNGISERKNRVLKEMVNSMLSYSRMIAINSIIESRDAIFDQNRFSSVPRPSLRIPNETEDIGGSVVLKKVTYEFFQQPELELRKSKRLIRCIHFHWIRRIDRLEQKLFSILEFKAQIFLNTFLRWFTYEVEVTNIPCNSTIDDDSEDEADDDMGYDPSDVAFIEWLRSKIFNYKTTDQYTMKALWIYWIRVYDEVEFTDKESFDNEDEIVKVLRIDTNIFDYETPICSAFNEFNYLLKVDPDLLTKDIEGFKTYEDYKDDWIYEWNKDVPWVDEKPWTKTRVWTKPTLVKHTCKPFNYKTGCSEWPMCSWKDNGYCKGGNLPGTYIIGNQLHYQDYEGYEALEDSKLKDWALQNKASMEGLISDDDDESCYEQRIRWNVFTKYDDTYEINDDGNGREELLKFKLPGEIISENRKQFRDNPFKDWCEKLNIKQSFAFVKHPQTNDQVERANRSLGEGIKSRLGEVQQELAVIPVEIGMPSIRCAVVNQAKNDEGLLLNLDILEERREKAASCQRKWKAGPKWDGPYEVVEALGKGAYKLRNGSGDVLPRTWNVQDLKKKSHEKEQSQKYHLEQSLRADTIPSSQQTSGWQEWHQIIASHGL